MPSSQFVASVGSQSRMPLSEAAPGMGTPPVPRPVSSKTLPEIQPNQRETPTSPRSMTVSPGSTVTVARRMM